MIMNQQTLDQKGQQLQAHIEGLPGVTPGKDLPQIEYKPRFVVHLLEMASENHQNEFQKMRM